jgi:hypothetical protein
MRDLLKIKDSSFVRDSSNMALLNTNKRAVLAHQERIRVVEKNLAQENKINNLEKEMFEVKSILQAILEKVSKQE